MNAKRYFLAAVAAAMVFAVLQYVGPNVYLQPEYEETKYLWRAKQDVNLLIVLLATVVYGFLFTFIFTKGYEARGIKEGLRFGIYATWFAAVPQFLYYYAAQPLPSSLVAKWLALSLGENMVLGAVVALIYRGPVHIETPPGA